VATDSKTETFAEMKLFINSFRWTGMPVYIRVGKALNRKGTEIGLKFKNLPRLLFNKDGNIEPNKIVFKIQPAEGIVVDMSSKIPALDFEITNTSMNFCYRDSFDKDVSDAYIKLLLDTLKCDRTLFVSAEETEISWKIFDPFLTKEEPKVYAKGTVPELCLCDDWIDFEKYVGIC
jgi:glucose-6-phosphate 1-dehydrogenase